jgi:hypothetical protein
MHPFSAVLAGRVPIPFVLAALLLVLTARWWLAPALRVATPMVIRWVPWLSWDYRHRRVPKRQMCPACGDFGKKDLRYDPGEKVVIVQCPTCMAAWGFAPIVADGKWARPPAPPEG